MTDPIALGLVKSLAKPGGNATGLSNIHIELTQKRLAMLKEVAPQVGTVGFLKPPFPDVEAYVSEIDAAARALKLKVHTAQVTNVEELEHAFAAMKAHHVGGVLLIPDPLRIRSANVSQFSP